MASESDTTTDHEEIPFRKFEGNRLAFLYQTQKANGSDSTLFKLVRR